jgi:hypothetical protein
LSFVGHTALKNFTLSTYSFGSSLAGSKVGSTFHKEFPFSSEPEAVAAGDPPMTVAGVSADMAHDFLLGVVCRVLVVPTPLALPQNGN